MDVADLSAGACVRAAAARLRASSDSPRLDAELLMAAVLGCTRTQLRTRESRPLDAAQAQAFERLIERRADHEPVAYLLGAHEFWSLPLRVSAAVLVPRPETELLVEWTLECLRGLPAPLIADLGTGSGAIALALARERPDARLIAVDASAAALALAAENAAALSAANIECRQGSWFAPLAGMRFDLLVSNPPYVADGDPHLPALKHEPRAALVSGSGGLADLRHLVEHAPDHLREGGWLLLEHGADQAAAVRGLLQARGFAEVRTRCDLAGCERASGARWSRA